MTLDPQYLTTEMETHRILTKLLGDDPPRVWGPPVEPIHHFVSIERTHASAT